MNFVDGYVDTERAHHVHEPWDLAARSDVVPTSTSNLTSEEEERAQKLRERIDGMCDYAGEIAISTVLEH